MVKHSAAFENKIRAAIMNVFIGIGILFHCPFHRFIVAPGRSAIRFTDLFVVQRKSQ